MTAPLLYGEDQIPAPSLGPAPLLPDDSDWPPATVRCDQDQHWVMPGEFCPHCGENPKCDDCPGRP